MAEFVARRGRSRQLPRQVEDPAVQSNLQHLMQLIEALERDVDTETVSLLEITAEDTDVVARWKLTGTLEKTYALRILADDEDATRTFDGAFELVDETDPDAHQVLMRFWPTTDERRFEFFEPVHIEKEDEDVELRLVLTGALEQTYLLRLVQSGTFAGSLEVVDETDAATPVVARIRPGAVERQVDLTDDGTLLFQDWRIRKTGAELDILDRATDTLLLRLTADGVMIASATGKIGEFGTAPVVRPAAYTQTYADTSRTMPAYTADDESAAYSGTDIGEPMDYTDTPAALGDAATLADLNNLRIATNATVASIAEVEELRVAYENLRAHSEAQAKVLNQLIDDLQARGTLQ